MLADLSAEGQAGLKETLAAWESRRKERTEKVITFTSRTGKTRKATSSTFQLIVKEWLLWVFFSIKGHTVGLAWMYEYDTKKDI